MVERRRQQEAAERQRAIDAAKEAASEAEPTGFDDQDEDGFDLREVGLKSRIYSYYWSQCAVGFFNPNKKYQEVFQFS